MEEIADDCRVISGDPSPIAPPPPPPANSSSAPTSWSAEDDDDDEEGDVCRICRCPGEPDNPLSYPCACSGSIKFVHEPCLLKWLDYSNARNCEVCKHPFAFTPVYAENAPSTLPLKEFVIGMVTKVCRLLQFSLRLACALSFWLLRLPLITYWMWRLSFARSFDGAGRLLLAHLSPRAIVFDCVCGLILSAIYMFAFLEFLIPLRLYLIGLRELDGDGALQIIGIGVGDLVAGFRYAAIMHEDYVRQFFSYPDPEDFSFLELIGVEVPVLYLVEEAIALKVGNAVFSGVGTFIPFSLGRLIISYLPLPFSITSCRVWDTSLTGLPSDCDATTLAVGYIMLIFMIFIYLNVRRARVPTSQLWKWCIIITLVSLWLIVVPLLIGLLYELVVIMPVRVPVKGDLVFILFRCWDSGMMHLNICTGVVYFADEVWRSNFKRLEEDGLSGLRGLWILREIFIPLFSKQLTALCILYACARGLFLGLGYPPIVNPTLYRLAWLICLLFVTVRICIKRFRVWFDYLHESIRRDRYRIGTRILNFCKDGSVHGVGVL